MSTTLADNEVTEFGMVVKHAYQGGGKLRSAVRLQTGVVGGTYRFPKIGKGQATPRIPQTNVVPMNVAHTKAEATITDWIAAEYTDIFNQQKVNYSERQLLGHIIAMAIGRREDQLLIDAWDAETHTNTVAEGIGGSNPLNVGKFLRSSRLMTEDGVPSTDRYMTLSAFGLENMLGITEATSSDFNSVKALVNGEINTYSGFQTIVIEERDEGGLPVATSNRTHWAFHGGMMGGTGLAIGLDFSVEVNYIPEKTSWLAAGKFAAGAKVIDLDGCVEIISDES